MLLLWLLMWLKNLIAMDLNVAVSASGGNEWILALPSKMITSQDGSEAADCPRESCSSLWRKYDLTVETIVPSSLKMLRGTGAFSKLMTRSRGTFFTAFDRPFHINHSFHIASCQRCIETLSPIFLRNNAILHELCLHLFYCVQSIEHACLDLQTCHSTCSYVHQTSGWIQQVKWVDEAVVECRKHRLMMNDVCTFETFH